MNNIFSNINLFTHVLLEKIIDPGDHVVDATIGNGNDTLFLAERVGPSGRVYGFDIQATAHRNTSFLLKKYGLLDRVTLINTGHENIKTQLSNPVKAVMFNLGYLPRGDHTVITLPETTISALQQALELLLPGGAITITVYTGHVGGQVEEEALEQFLKNLDKKAWDVLVWSFLNRSLTAPYLIVIYRRGGLRIENKTS